MAEAAFTSLLDACQKLTHLSHNERGYITGTDSIWSQKIYTGPLTPPPQVYQWGFTDVDTFQATVLQFQSDQLESKPITVALKLTCVM